MYIDTVSTRQFKLLIVQVNGNTYCDIEIMKIFLTISNNSNFYSFDKLVTRCTLFEAFQLVVVTVNKKLNNRSLILII